MMKLLTSLLACVLIAGCSDSEPKQTTAYREKRLAQQSLAKDYRDNGPKTKVTKTPSGDIIELMVPIIDGRFVEIKHCVVWRDNVTKTSSVSCDRPSIDSLPLPSEQQ